MTKPAKTPKPRKRLKAKPKVARKPETPKKVGRPSKYTPELLEAICERLAKAEPMAVICRSEGTPDRSTVHDWAERYPDVSRRLARAREDGFDVMAQECVQIANDGSNDYYATDKGLSLDRDHISRSKLRVETRLKLLAVWDPKRYGPKTMLTGPSGEEVPPTTFLMQPVKPV
jgi:hypothetical protein